MTYVFKLTGTPLTEDSKERSVAKPPRGLPLEAALTALIPHHELDALQLRDGHDLGELPNERLLRILHAPEASSAMYNTSELGELPYKIICFADTWIPNPRQTCRELARAPLACGPVAVHSACHVTGNQ